MRLPVGLIATAVTSGKGGELKPDGSFNDAKLRWRFKVHQSGKNLKPVRQSAGIHPHFFWPKKLAGGYFRGGQHVDGCPASVENNQASDLS